MSGSKFSCANNVKVDRIPSASARYYPAAIKVSLIVVVLVLHLIYSTNPWESFAAYFVCQSYICQRVRKRGIRDIYLISLHGRQNTKARMLHYIGIPIHYRVWDKMPEVISDLARLLQSCTRVVTYRDAAPSAWYCFG